MKEVITSLQNPVIKHVKSLHKKKYRDKYGQFFIEGRKMLEEAIREGADIELIIVSREFPFKIEKNSRVRQIKTVFVKPGVFKSISDTQSPQGIMAVINKKHSILDEVLNRPTFFLTVLDNVQDPGNVGTIIRTMDAAGGDGVVLLKGCADPYNPKTLRSTMGSIFRVPVYQIDDYKNLFEVLREKRAYILVSHLKGTNLFEWSGDGGFKKTVLVIGNESRGVRKEICDFSSTLIKIPIIGGAESLNASVAAGILIYEIVRKGRRIL